MEFNGVSKSQIKQDIFVLSETGFKGNSYFVEFGGNRPLGCPALCPLPAVPAQSL